MMNLLRLSSMKPAEMQTEFPRSGERPVQRDGLHTLHTLYTNKDLRAIYEGLLHRYVH